MPYILCTLARYMPCSLRISGTDQAVRSGDNPKGITAAYTIRSFSYTKSLYPALRKSGVLTAAFVRTDDVEVKLKLDVYIGTTLEATY
jgi:hypothetical protein